MVTVWLALQGPTIVKMEVHMEAKVNVTIGLEVRGDAHGTVGPELGGASHAGDIL